MHRNRHQSQKDIDFNAVVEKNFDKVEEIKDYLTPYKTRFGKAEFVSKLLDVDGMTITRREFIAGVGSITLLASPVFNARAAALNKRNLVIIMPRRDGRADGGAAA